MEVDITMLTKQEYIPAYIYAEGPGPVWFRGDGCHGDEKSLSECALQQESHCTDELVELICQVNNISISGNVLCARNSYLLISHILTTRFLTTEIICREL